MTNLHEGTSRNRETKSLPYGPPPKASSYMRDNEVLNQQGKSLGVEQCVHTLKDKGMQTQYEVNDFSRETFISKLNSPPLPQLGYGLFISFKCY